MQLNELFDQEDDLNPDNELWDSEMVQAVEAGAFNDLATAALAEYNAGKTLPL